MTAAVFAAGVKPRDIVKVGSQRIAGFLKLERAIKLSKSVCLCLCMSYWQSLPCNVLSASPLWKACMIYPKTVKCSEIMMDQELSISLTQLAIGLSIRTSIHYASVSVMTSVPVTGDVGICAPL